VNSEALLEKVLAENAQLRKERDQARELAKLDHIVIEELRVREKYLANLLRESGLQLRQMVTVLKSVPMVHTYECKLKIGASESDCDCYVSKVRVALKTTK
jgi:hypothetical protein